MQIDEIDQAICAMAGCAKVITGTYIDREPKASWIETLFWEMSIKTK